jgi:hypothetical protein
LARALGSHTGPLSPAARHPAPAPPVPGRRRDVPSAKTRPDPTSRSRTAITPLLDRSPPPSQVLTAPHRHRRRHCPATCTTGLIPQLHTANPGQNLAGHAGNLPEPTLLRPLHRRSLGGYPPEPTFPRL